MATIDYEKKYKALVEAVKTLKEANPSDDGIQNWVKDNVPELKESEDERVIKSITRLIKAFYDVNFPTPEGFSRKDLFAWLEKKGELKPQGKSALEAAKEEKVDNQNCVKPNDKVEPKFENGQWIVWQDKCYKVNYNGCGYELVDQKGLSTSLEYGTVDENAHIYDITKDAKGGDVLEFGDHGRLVVGIVSYINKSTGKVDVYCLLEANNFKVGNYYALDTINPHPATKEQRELLFQKMHEAGYEWDAAKKELKKIEQKFAEWNEEDETKLTTAQTFISNTALIGNDGIKNATIDWLKSLKDRVQPKQEWSEEDERRIEECAREAEDNNCIILAKHIRQLKSIRPQWKPSEEMLEALYRAIPENVMEISEDEMLLDKLYQGLKYGRVLSKK